MNDTSLTICLNKIQTLDKETQDKISNIAIPKNNLGYESIIGDTLDALSDLLYKGLSGIQDMFITTSIVIDGVNDYKTKTPNIKTLNKLQIQVMKSIKNDKLNIPKIYNTKAPVTLGLNVTLEEMYKEVLSLTVYTDNTHNTLTDVNNMLDDMVSSSLSDIKTHIPRDMTISKLDKTNTTISKTLSSLVNSKVVIDIKPVKELISKVNTLPVLLQDVIKLGKSFKTESLLDINDLVDSITSKVNVVIKTLHSNKEDLDKKTLYSLSNYLKIIAEHITVVTFTYYSYYQLVDMLVGVSRIVTHEKSLSIKETESFLSRLNIMSGLTNNLTDKIQSKISDMFD